MKFIDPTHPLHAEWKSKILDVFGSKVPTYSEIDRLAKTYKGIVPNAKVIQRYGGIRKFVEVSLGRTYSHANSKIAASSTTNLPILLEEIFGKQNVVMNPLYPFSKIHADFKVKDFYVEVFTPRDMHTFVGCIRSKLKRLPKLPRGTRVYFLSANEEYIKDFSIKAYIESREVPLPSNIAVMTVSDAIQEFNLMV